METVDLGETDRRILSILSDNARKSDEEIADALNLSAEEVADRIDSLRSEGIITGFSAMLDTAKIGYISVAFGFSVEPGKADDIAETLSQYDNIYKLWILSGRHNIIAHANFEDITKFQQFSSERLRDIDGIASYETSIVTNSVLNEGDIVLDDI
jgi:Lrp/AsnC family leucine-responsive transcriptional regulator